MYDQDLLLVGGTREQSTKADQVITYSSADHLKMDRRNPGLKRLLTWKYIFKQTFRLCEKVREAYRCIIQERKRKLKTQDNHHSRHK